jgi:hypothetical protein
MNGDSERDAAGSEPRRKDRASHDTRFRRRDGLRSVVILLLVLAAVACLIFIGRNRS